MDVNSQLPDPPIDPLKKDPVLSVLWLILLTTLGLILAHHLLAWSFYKSFVELWDKYLPSLDLTIEIEKADASVPKRKCGCFSLQSMIKIGHVSEWVGLWRASGWVTQY